MTNQLTAAPAATASTDGTELTLCLRRTGVVEHHEFVLNIPDGVTKEAVIAEFKKDAEFFWQVFRNQGGCQFGTPANRTIECGAVITEDCESETHYDFQEIEVQVDD